MAPSAAENDTDPLVGRPFLPCIHLKSTPILRSYWYEERNRGNYRTPRLGTGKRWLLQPWLSLVHSQPQHWHLLTRGRMGVWMIQFFHLTTTVGCRQFWMISPWHKGPLSFFSDHSEWWYWPLSQALCNLLWLSLRWKTSLVATRLLF